MLLRIWESGIEGKKRKASIIYSLLDYSSLISLSYPIKNTGSPLKSDVVCILDMYGHYIYSGKPNDALLNINGFQSNQKIVVIKASGNINREVDASISNH